MPLYNTTANGVGIVNCKAYSPQTVVNNEALTVGQASLQVALSANKETNTTAFYVFAQFATDPGATPSLAVQVADFDSDANYVTVANGTFATSATTPFTARFDAQSVISAKFARVKLIALTTGGTLLTVRIGQ